MSIQSAMRAGVSGLNAQSVKMGSIADNIANSKTDGYKRGQTNFSTLVTGNNGGAYQAGGVRASTRIEVSKIGLIQSTGYSTDMSIAGEGFFAVSKDGVSSSLTRAGSFRPDQLGNLVNVAGYKLMGWPIGDDGTIGNVDYENLNGLQAVNTANANMSAVATTEVRFTGNLPANETGPNAPTDPFRSSIEYYDALGNAQKMVVEWLPSTTPNQWTLTVTNATGVPYGSVDVEFGDSAPTAGIPIAYTNVVSSTPGFAFDAVTGAMSINAEANTTTQPITLNFGRPNTFEGTTQLAAEYSPKTTKNGSAAGTLKSFEVTESGQLIGVFSNNSRRPLWQIPVVTVINPDGLSRGDGNVFDISSHSGDARLNIAGQSGAGVIVGGALEGSNVDSAEELIQMIETQRAYSMNAKTITTSDEMTEEVARIKR